MVSKRTNNWNRDGKTDIKSPSEILLTRRTTTIYVYVTIILAYEEGKKHIALNRKNILFGFYGCNVARILRLVFKKKKRKKKFV